MRVVYQHLDMFHLKLKHDGDFFNDFCFYHKSLYSGAKERFDWTKFGDFIEVLQSDN